MPRRLKPGERRLMPCEGFPRKPRLKQAGTPRCPESIRETAQCAVPAPSRHGGEDVFIQISLRVSKKSLTHMAHMTYETHATYETNKKAMD